MEQYTSAVVAVRTRGGGAVYLLSAKSLGAS